MTTVYKIDKRNYNRVVNYFNTHDDNRTSTIAKIYGLDYHIVSFYLDHYLSQKKNYYKI